MDEQYNGPVMTGNYNTGSPEIGATVQEKKRGFAIASLVCGILSLIGFCCCADLTMCSMCRIPVIPRFGGRILKSTVS